MHAIVNHQVDEDKVVLEGELGEYLELFDGLFVPFYHLVDVKLLHLVNLVYILFGCRFQVVEPLFLLNRGGQRALVLIVLLDVVEPHLLLVQLLVLLLKLLPVLTPFHHVGE